MGITRINNRSKIVDPEGEDISYSNPFPVNELNDSDLSTSLGLNPDASRFIVVGSDETIGENYTDVSGIGDVVLPSSAVALEIVSSSVNDNSAGTGAREVTWILLDGNGDPTTVSVIPNGVTPVAIPGTFKRIRAGNVSDSGSSNWNEGTLTLRQVSGSIPLGGIASTLANVLSSFYTVPNNVLAGPDNAQINAGKNTDLDFQFKAMLPGTNTWISVNFYNLYMTIASFKNKTVNVLPPGTDVKAIAKGTATASQVNVILDIYELDVTP